MFINCDGIDGSGKSTVLLHLAEKFRKEGKYVELTREPGGTVLAEEIRSLTLAHREEHVAEMTELLLMYAARCQNVEGIIKPALLQNKIVITDRFSTSTVAYQSFGRGIPLEKVYALEKMVLNGFKPDLTFIMDIDPVVSLERAKKRNILDRIESEAPGFFHRAREGFLFQAKRDPRSFRVIDASRSIEEVKEQVDFELKKYLVMINKKTYKEELLM
jgi:thymidylate kinase